MPSTRRDFRQISATAAAASSLAPLAGRETGAESVAPNKASNLAPGAAADTPAEIRAIEQRMLHARPFPIGTCDSPADRSSRRKT